MTTPTAEARWAALDKRIKEEIAALKCKKWSEEYCDKSREIEAALTADLAPGECGAYAKWRLRQCMLHRPVIEVPPLPTYQAEIQTLDIRDDVQVFGLNRLLNTGYARYIPLGTFMGHTYRLIPGSTVLISDVPVKYPSLRYTNGGQILGRSFLAMNPQTVPLVMGTNYVRSGGKATSPTVSNATASLHSEEKDAFVFFQLGYLEYINCSPEQLGDKRHERKGWTNSHFAVVLKLTPEVIRDGVYIVFCLNPLYVDECDGEQARVAYERTDTSWGYLPNFPGTQIFYAQIADSFEDLREENEFSVTDIHQRPTELTYDMKTKDGIFKGDSTAAKASKTLHKKARLERSKTAEAEKEKRRKDKTLPDPLPQHDDQAEQGSITPP